MITNGNVELPGVKTVSDPLHQLSYYSLLILKGIVVVLVYTDVRELRVPTKKFAGIAQIWYGLQQRSRRYNSSPPPWIVHQRVHSILGSPFLE
jgi:hypothetical protein